jgi:hypothetical protein
VVKKPTFADIWISLGLDCAPLLADMAEVNSVVVYKMIAAQPVRRWQAQYVLDALSALTEISFTLKTVEVILYPDESST